MTTSVAEKKAGGLYENMPRQPDGKFLPGVTGGGRPEGAQDKKPRGLEALWQEMINEWGDRMGLKAQQILNDADPKSYLPSLKLLDFYQRRLEFEQKKLEFERSQKKGTGTGDYQVIFTKREKGYDPMLDPTHPINQRRLQGRPAAGQSLQALAPHHVQAPPPVLTTEDGEPLDLVD